MTKKNMKRMISIALVLALMLSFGAISAFAEVRVDGESQGDGVVTHDGDAQFVSADASGDKLTVDGYVNNSDPDSLKTAVSATNSAEVTVNSYVSNAGENNTIYANGSTVTVKDYVEDTGDGHAIYANDSTVTVNGSVTEDGSGHAISAGYSTITVNGSVTEDGNGSAINVQGATIIVIDDVKEEGAGDAISAVGGTVKVGGDVTADSPDNAVSSGFGATVIVEGLVTGDLSTNGNDQIKSGTIYIGQLDGNIKDDADLGKIHYLIGTAEGSADLSVVTLKSDIVASGTIDGVNEEGYKYTTTADQDALNGQTIILVPAAGKILMVSGFEGADVTCVQNEDGSVTITIGGAFNGGLQDLVLELSNKPGPDPDPDPIYVGPSVSVTVVELTLPDGVEEGLITKLDSANHAGITIDKSLLAEGDNHDIKVTLNGEELPKDAYSFRSNKDGSLSLILSNTYMSSLGNGTYDLVAEVDGLEIPFTVEVAK